MADADNRSRLALKQFNSGADRALEAENMSDTLTLAASGVCGRRIAPTATIEPPLFPAAKPANNIRIDRTPPARKTIRRTEPI
jgi:hypothetical protein